MSETDDTELVKLLQEMETMARDLVQKAGGCPPFGGTIDNHQQIGLIFEDAAVTGRVTPESRNKVLVAIRRTVQPANIRAAAVSGMAYVKDPQTNRQTTAVVITLHHRGGRNIDYIIPFSKAASGAVTFGKPTTGLSQTKLF